MCNADNREVKLKKNPEHVTSKKKTEKYMYTVASNECFSPPTGSVDMDKVHYCERFLELLVDLEVLSNFNYVVRHS